MAPSSHDSAFSQVPHTLRRSYFSASPPSILRAQSHLDEGFSEGQSDSEMAMIDTMAEVLHDLTGKALDLPLSQRKELAEALIRSIPNADKEDIGNLCERLTHFDPVRYLPNELMLHILSYLTPKDLLTCSTVSRYWRGSSQDNKLWRSCFAREGWVVDTAKIKEFEEDAQRRSNEISSRHRQTGLRRSGSHKRPHEEAFSEVDTPGSQARLASPTTSMRANLSHDSSSDGMDYVEVLPPDDMDQDISDKLSTTGVPTSESFMESNRRSTGSIKFSPTLFRDPEDQRLSWPYLYKQRCRLEKNWEAGRFEMFQLPHRDYPLEGHEECVYTIQHNSNYLVSGSRDRTIRIWDLKEMRLKGKPLTGHDASVLCLQFDDRPDQDIIASGGSDSYVIIWKFSTGEVIKKMTNAHTESVLNLRFDDRYIVTCSKDKTIKLWNRKALSRDDPSLPTHILDSSNGYFDKHDMVKEFSLLHTLIGHGAAVNAVMIHKDTIVSASGDRTIKAWNILNGKLRRTYSGHTKGIACVQFDGRRIVSGSSDNTVRVFDAKAANEVACLQGHDNLVRTVQARFGDLSTVTDQELIDETKRADRRFHQEVGRGMVPATTSRNGPRNPGSSRPQDMLAWGGTIPPGGGGSRWAKIVSGSYDETVIIWKRDREGKWVVKHRLQQGHHSSRSNARRLAAQTAQQLAALQAHGTNPAQPPNPQHTHAQQLHLAHNGLAQANQAVQGQAPGHGPPLPQTALNNLAHAQHLLNQQINQQGANTNPPANPTTAPAVSHTTNPAAPPPHQHHHHHNQHGARPHSDSNRVFKLEFDARRIVCCSQNKIIVGWDFAAGDKELEQIGEWSLETQ